jgi:general secretion pathway protein E
LLEQQSDVSILEFRMQAPGKQMERFEEELGEALVDAGRLERRGLDRALRLRSGPGDLIELLPRLGLISERDLAEAIAHQLGLPLLEGRDYPETPVLKDRIGVRFLRDSRVVPLAASDDHVMLAMANPLDRFAIDAVRLIAGREVRASVAIPAELDAAIDRLYGRDHAVAPHLAEEQAILEDDSLDADRLKDMASEAPVVRLVNQLIFGAMDRRASDIHIEPFDDRLRVRYRIDGALREVEEPPFRLRAAIVSRIKIMARLNIAERRLPQDGRMSMSVRGAPVDLRVATTPTMHGESVVMRILNRDSVRLDFAALGFHGESLHAYLGILDRPNGIVLVTGPTGSGKTTTLYASLVRLNTPDRKILSVEDPVEYDLEGINQIQVKPAIGLDFASVLRSSLRHDPDIMMVGEIRDLETAEISIQAALTGHLVLSTLHTNSAASSITRLLDMGVRDFLLTSTINGVAAQRLVRTLCRFCREPYDPMPELIERLGLARFADGAPLSLYRPRGCSECGGTGYYGRTSIFEVLVVNEAIRKLILRNAEASELQRAAMGHGMRTMYVEGMMKALAGETTVDEVLKAARDSWR